MSILSKPHVHVEDLLKKLKEAKDKGLPVYPAPGPCGGCDLVIGAKKELEHKDLLSKLEKADPKTPVYPGEGPCGGCDLVIQS